MLPDWAERALGKYRPRGPADGRSPNAQRLAWWEATRSRFVERWQEIGAEGWAVPAWDDSYAQLHVVIERADFVRLCIFESALDLAWLDSKKQSPARIREAMRDLDSINDKVQAAAGELFGLLAQRDQLLLDYFQTDDPEGDLLDVNPDEVWLMKLRDLADLRRSAAQPLDDATAAGLRSSTNATVWSRWARAYLAKIDRWAPFPRGFLRSCLSLDDLATLLEVALDAPAGAFNTDSLRQLERRLHKSSKYLDADDSSAH